MVREAMANRRELCVAQALQLQEAAREAERAAQSAQDAERQEEMRRRQEEKREKIMAELAKLRERREQSAALALAKLNTTPKLERVYNGDKPARAGL